MTTAGIDRDRVVRALRDVKALPDWSLAEWDLLVRQARQADLLARIACQLDAHGLIERVAPGPRAHLEAVKTLAAAQQDEVRREVMHIKRALRDQGEPVIVLKGAAYLIADLPPAAGRLFSDVDILVPKAQLDTTETQLMLHGWATTHHSAYDQRYYREWMHELPPMEHMRRQTVLDVHHTILPETARLKPPAAKLFKAAVTLASGLRVLAPCDMVLHSITHLLHNDELSHGLRDLSDIDLLLRHFAAQRPDFWAALVERSREMDLARPLHYGLHCARRILGTPVPDDVLVTTARAAPPAPLSTLMDALWWRALRSQHATAAQPLTSAALFLLYVRAHWLRMPPLLLVRHLTIKALKLHEDPKAT